MSKSKKLANAKYKTKNCPSAAKVGLTSVAVVLGGLAAKVAYSGVSNTVAVVKTVSSTVGTGLSVVKDAVAIGGSVVAGAAVSGVNALLSSKSNEYNNKNTVQYYPPVEKGKLCSNAVNSTNPCEPMTLEQGLELGAAGVGLCLLGYGLYKYKTRAAAAQPVIANETDTDSNYSELESGNKTVASSPRNPQG